MQDSSPGPQGVHNRGIPLYVGDAEMGEGEGGSSHDSRERATHH